MMTRIEELPVAVIGAGPVGLAAAAHLIERGLRPVIFERGESVGASLLEWAHVRVFSPWRYNIDAAARRLLEFLGMACARRRCASHRRRDRRSILGPARRSAGDIGQSQARRHGERDHAARPRQSVVQRSRQGALRRPLHRQTRRAPVAGARGHRCVRHLDSAEPDRRRWFGRAR